MVEVRRQFCSLCVVVLVCFCITVHCGVPPCSRSVSSVIGSEMMGADGMGRKLIPLGFDERVEKLVQSDVLKLLDAKGVRAVFFMERGDFLDHERFIRGLVAKGHHLGLSIFRDSVDSVPIHETGVTRIIATEQAFAESVTGKKPLLLLAPTRSSREVLNNASRAIGTFLLEWDITPLDDVPQLLTEREFGGVEKFMDTEQIHCAFDRTSCDFVGRWEVFREQCRRFRIEFFTREEVDLFKFVPRRQQKKQRRGRSSEEVIGEDEPLGGDSFVDRNRFRVEKAYERVDSGSHLREVMLILFSYSDRQVESNLDRTLSSETRDYRVTTLNILLYLAIAFLFLWMFITVRKCMDHDHTLARRTASKGTKFLHSIAEFSKAE